MVLVLVQKDFSRSVTTAIYELLSGKPLLYLGPSMKASTANLAATAAAISSHSGDNSSCDRLQ